MKRIAIVLALGMVCLPTMSGYTTIVIRKTADYIVVGSDSLWIHARAVIDKRGKWHTTNRTTHQCKIRQFNNTFFAQSGYWTRLDVLALAEQAAKQGTSIPEKAAIYEGLTKSKLADDWEDVRQAMPDVYRQLVGGTPFEAIFFGSEHGKPVIAAVVYKIASLPTQRVAIECQTPECVQVYRADTWINLFMGENREIFKYGGDVNFWDSNGSDEAIRKLINMEISAHPDEVGGPIDMIYVGSGDAHWIDRGPECPDIKPTTHMAPANRR